MPATEHCVFCGREINETDTPRAFKASSWFDVKDPDEPFFVCDVRACPELPKVPGS